MSVYTQLTDQQFSDFCQQFGVDFAKAIPITQGIKTVIGLLKQPRTKPASRLMYLPCLKNANRMKFKNGDYPKPLKRPATRSRTPLPPKRRVLLYFDNKAIVVSPKLSGGHPKATTPDMCRQMGEALAVLHQTLQTLTPAQNYGVELYPLASGAWPWNQVYAKRWSQTDEWYLASTKL